MYFTCYIGHTQLFTLHPAAVNLHAFWHWLQLYTWCTTAAHCLTCYSGPWARPRRQRTCISPPAETWYPQLLLLLICRPQWVSRL